MGSEGWEAGHSWHSPSPTEKLLLARAGNVFFELWSALARGAPTGQEQGQHRGDDLLVVSDQLFAATKADALEAWVRTIVPQTVRRHPEWAQQVGIDGVERTFREIERFSCDYGFEAEESFWQVLDARVADPGLLSGLTEFQIFALSRKHASEKMRLQRFLEDRTRGSHTVLVKLGFSEQEAR